MTLNPHRLALFSDWAQTLAPRPLPRTVVPLPGEFHLDYVRRLAHANHLEFLQLTCALTDPNTHTQHGGAPAARAHQQQRLARAASQPLARIARLYWPDPTTYLRDPEGLRRSLRPACRRCCARLGLREPTPCKLADHATICRRHRLWIGPDVAHPDDQYDLSPFPEYLTAARRHRQLQRHQPDRLPAALRELDQQLHRRLQHHGPTAAQQRRLAHIAPHIDPTRQRRHPALTAAIYPELIHNTGRRPPAPMAQVS